MLIKELNNLLDNMINTAVKDDRKKTIEWAEDYMEQSWKIYGTDKHNISLEDLKDFLNKKI